MSSFMISKADLRLPVTSTVVCGCSGLSCFYTSRSKLYFQCSAYAAGSPLMRACVCACMCACLHACVHACVRMILSSEA